MTPSKHARPSAVLSLLASLALGCGPRDPTAFNVSPSTGASTTSSTGASTTTCSLKDLACTTACHPRDTHVAWEPLPTDGAPSARRLHAMVWTGKEVLVWGGMVDGLGNGTSSGAAYNPATNTWRAITEKGAPAARHSHQAVWTGSKMLVWGGYIKGGYAKDGGAYDPATDSWTPIPQASIGGRTRHSSVWTGSELLVWGGLNGQGPLGDGAAFNPATSSWTTLTGSGPKARASHAAVWTGDAMVVWGGTNTFDWFADGATLEGASHAWKDSMSDDGAPTLRESSTGIWASCAMLIWGGWNGGTYQDSGALYDPVSDAWTPMAENAPTGRAGHVSIWTGDELFVWGGCTGDSCSELLGDGGRYTAQDGWTKVSANAKLSPRTGAVGVWTGTDVIVFGGSDASFKPIGGGARAPL